ncbi:MAG: MFS transporter [Candidatus Geothermarchaeales archaeon]
MLGQYRGLGREIRLLVVARGLTRLPFGFLRVVQAIYLASLGFDPLSIGILLTITSIAGTLAVLPSGFLAYRVGLKRLLTMGILLRAVTWTIYASTPNYGFLAAAAVVGGFGNALYFAPLHAFTAEKSPEDRRQAVFSISSFAATGMGFVGALMSGLPDYLQETLGWGVADAYRPLFMLAVVLLLGSALALAPLEDVKKELKLQNFVRMSSRRTIGKFAVTNGLIGFGAGFVIPLFSLWFFLRFGLTGAFLGPLFAASDATTAVAYLTAPRMAQILGTVRSVAATEFLATLILVAIPLVDQIPLVSILFVARGLLMHVSMPVQSSFMMGQVESEERALLSSIVSPPLGLVWGTPQSLSKLAGGFLMELGMLSLPFYLCASFYFASIGAFYAFFRRTEE